jgi:hypothetical protein
MTSASNAKQVSRFQASVQLTEMLSLASVCISHQMDDDEINSELTDQLYTLKSDHYNSLKDYFCKEYTLRDRTKNIDFNRRLKGATQEFKDFYSNAQRMPTERLSELIAKKTFEMEALEAIYASKKALVRENILLASAFDTIEDRKSRAIKRKIEATADMATYYATHSPLNPFFEMPTDIHMPNITKDVPEDVLTVAEDEA